MSKPVYEEIAELLESMGFEIMSECKSYTTFSLIGQTIRVNFDLPDIDVPKVDRRYLSHKNLDLLNNLKYDPRIHGFIRSHDTFIKLRNLKRKISIEISNRVYFKDAYKTFDTIEDMLYSIRSSMQDGHAAMMKEIQERYQQIVSENQSEEMTEKIKAYVDSYKTAAKWISENPKPKIIRLINKSIKTAIISLAAESKCDRVAILHPYDFSVLKVINKYGKIYTPSDYSETTFDFEEQRFNWRAKKVDWYSYSSETYDYVSDCPPMAAFDQAGEVVNTSVHGPNGDYDYGDYDHAY